VRFESGTLGLWPFDFGPSWPWTHAAASAGAGMGMDENCQRVGLPCLSLPSLAVSGGRDTKVHACTGQLVPATWLNWPVERFAAL
jgi:hypothetical protein